MENDKNLTYFFWNNLSPVLDVLRFIFYFVYLFNFGFVVYPLVVSRNELKTKRLQVFRIIRVSSIIIDSQRFETT